ncbi:transglycosylase SLT domain-containing protein [Caldimonas brevitalea]|uniref:Lytic transglycosylase n=1 Tax=Caldimonas brevitalea TaxID=413882 RepID=A0A0G3BQV6_9BURK|nr:transglycosylase SLT domain-containing protein [Caldimonas brevitalea]AKJ31789.1 lytic transglycosylase [Caldimonas brevitalea]
MIKLVCSLSALCCALALGVAAQAAEPPPEAVLIPLLRAEAMAYEYGDAGMPRDARRAAALYCEAARLGDAEAQFNLGWMYANGRGLERNDSLAAFFFQAAAEQGYEQAQRMLQTVGGPTTEVPECMRSAPPAPATRTTASASASAALAPLAKVAPPSILALVQKMAPEYRVQPQLALAIMQAESNFDTVALSPRNAKGLMQLIPATAERFRVRNPYDPAQNIRGGLAYLRWLLAYFEGDVTLVAAAYNAGEGTVERYRGVPPYLETRRYVQRIRQAVGDVLHPFDPSVTRPSPWLRQIRQPAGAR